MCDDSHGGKDVNVVRESSLKPKRVSIQLFWFHFLRHVPCIQILAMYSVSPVVDIYVGVSLYC